MASISSSSADYRQGNLWRLNSRVWFIKYDVSVFSLRGDSRYFGHPTGSFGFCSRVCCPTVAPPWWIFYYLKRSLRDEERAYKNNLQWIVRRPTTTTKNEMGVQDTPYVDNRLNNKTFVRSWKIYAVQSQNQTLPSKISIVISAEALTSHHLSSMSSLQCQ